MDTESPLATAALPGSLDTPRRLEMRLRTRRVSWGKLAYPNTLYVGGGLVKWIPQFAYPYVAVGWIWL